MADLATGGAEGAEETTETGPSVAQRRIVRLRPERANHVWSYDFVQDRTEDGRPFPMLCIIDEFTRRCLVIVVACRLRSDDVLHCLTDLFVEHGPQSTSGRTTGQSSRPRRWSLARQARREDAVHRAG
jgi:hypothetical protein